MRILRFMLLRLVVPEKIVQALAERVGRNESEPLKPRHVGDVPADAAG